MAVVFELCDGDDTGICGGEIHVGSQRHHDYRLEPDFNGIYRPFLFPRPGALVCVAVRRGGVCRGGAADCGRQEQRGNQPLGLHVGDAGQYGVLCGIAPFAEDD